MMSGHFRRIETVFQNLLYLEKTLKGIVVSNKLQPIAILMFEGENDAFYRAQYKDYDHYRNEYNKYYRDHYPNYWDYYEDYHNYTYTYSYDNETPTTYFYDNETPT